MRRKSLCGKPNFDFLNHSLCVSGYIGNGDHVFLNPSIYSSKQEVVEEESDAENTPPNENETGNPTRLLKRFSAVVNRLEGKLRCKESDDILLLLNEKVLEKESPSLIELAFGLLHLELTLSRFHPLLLLS